MDMERKRKTRSYPMRKNYWHRYFYQLAHCVLPLENTPHNTKTHRINVDCEKST